MTAPEVPWSDSDRARVAAILASLPGCPDEDDDCPSCNADRDKAITEVLEFAVTIKAQSHA